MSDLNFNPPGLGGGWGGALALSGAQELGAAATLSP